MRFGSVCSGIEAASVAWGPLGWKAAWFSEIEPFPSAVLKHHYPDTPNLGDMTLLVALIRAGLVEAPDVLCGGTPCQAFSVAGLRKSLDDARGNLSLTFCEIANAIDDRRDIPCIVFWENVPGVLSTPDNAFGCFLAGLAGEDEPLVVPGPTPRPGKPWKWPNAGLVVGPRRTVAWRVMDAQYTGVAQRRRRVFVVASARTDFDPAEVLFEFDGVRRDTAPSRAEAQDVAGTLAGGARSGGGYSYDDIPTVGTLTSNHKGDGVGQESKLVPHVTGTLLSNGKAAGSATQQDAESGMLIAYGGNNTSGPIDAAAALNCNGGQRSGDFEAGTLLTVTHSLRGEGFDASEDGTGRGTPLVPVLPFDTTQITSATNRCRPAYGDPCHPLAAGAHAPAIAFHGAQDPDISGDITHPVAAQTNGLSTSALVGMRVRRLTPRECERLQAFPDDYTLIPTWNGWRKMDASETPESCRAEGLEVRQSRKTGKWTVRDVDGPRYKALGNSWAVTNVRWIGERIQRGLPQ